jgi:DNA-binding response OmpR family regulator
MAKENFLIIEDDPDIVELVQYNLEREGFRVFAARDGESGLKEATSRRPNLILLDLMLPGIEGLEVCRTLKESRSTRSIPLVMLTAKGEESDIVLGLEMGADDYVTKPFSPRELLARLKAVLRRGTPRDDQSAPAKIEQGALLMDAERHEVFLHGKPLVLTLAEFRLLWVLAAHPGRVLTRDQLVEKITAGESIVTDRNVDVHISSLRKKLRSDEELIVTVRGIGYKFKDEPRP